MCPTRSRDKGQAATEFFVMIGVALAILAVFVAIQNYQSRASYSAQVRIDETGVCNRFATAVNLAATGGNGFITKINLPQYIKGMDYSIGIENRTVSVVAGNDVSFCRIITKEVNYTEIPRGEVIMSNEDGTIQIQ